MRITAIYVRQSLEKDGSLSLDTQKDTCKTVLSDKEIKNLEIFEDEGYSGKNTNRPSINSLIAKVENDEVAKIVVYKLDRISRNISDFYRLYETMEKHGCQFVSATESFDTGSSMGKAMMGILAVFAQMERENIQKRVKDNYYDRIEKRGTWPGGPAPFGFKNAKTPENLPTLVPNEDEKPAVEYLFYHYANDLQTSLGSLSKILFEKGYRSHKRKGGLFDNVTISRILKNPVYVKADQLLYNYLHTKDIRLLNSDKEWDGSTSVHIVNKKPYVNKDGKRVYTDETEWKAYLTNFQGFIDSETFIKVQERLNTNKQIGRANSDSKLDEFAGKIKCANCGYAIKIYSGKTLSCYGNKSLHICDSNFSRHSIYPKCHLDDIRLIVAQEIARYYSVLLISYNKRKEDYKKLERKKETLENQRNILLSSLKNESSISTREFFINDIRKISEEIHEIEIKTLEFSRIKEIELEEKMEYSKLTFEQRKALINKLIDKILLRDNTKGNETGKHYYVVDIVWKNNLLEEYQKMESEIYAGLSEEKRYSIQGKIECESLAMMTEKKMHAIVKQGPLRFLKNGKTPIYEQDENELKKEMAPSSEERRACPVQVGKKTIQKAVRFEYTHENNTYKLVFLASGDYINGKLKNINEVPLDSVKNTFKSYKSFMKFKDDFCNNFDEFKK